ncbi:M20 family metallopeptidase [Elioraea sp. Yellowstone]|jgi:glutamate carboxypeptidase|uniref:M20 family metallopeptidase n=1 Tax=Elioraea sp. Yellowstone TaxID=2592070 RepID=UPI00114DE05D|nr:M20 family metallopeptidase [Elioraea sp. Yellowstone]TQF82490.1 M20 family metallopeptidase [Elioraea sp. Yellowstone]
MNLASPETAISDWLATQKQAMLDLLERLVNIDSGSYDKEGVDAVGAQIKAFFDAHGIAVETIPGATKGDVLRAVLAAPDQAGGNAGRNIVLMGHRDTVFPKGEAERRPFRIENGRAYGPGVADMKAGLVMNAFVLAAFRKFGAAPGPMVGLFTGDEEIGSPEGRAVIEAEGRMARAVFNAEPGRPSGNVVTARKGGVFMVMAIEGKAAHSGGNFEAGISAIEELARKIIAIHALTDLKAGVTLNVGLVRGGQSVNTVAPFAEGEIDLRYVEPAQRDDIVAKIEAIVRTANVPGTRATLAIKGEFLPVNPTAASNALFETYVGAAADAGLKVAGEFSGGCADSGFTAAVGAPTICGVGPVGGKAHSPEEYLEIDSMVPRAQALARAICRLPQAGL